MPFRGVCAFGPFHLDISSKRLQRDGAHVALQGRQVDVDAEVARIGVVVEGDHELAGPRNKKDGIGCRVEGGAGPGAELIGRLEDPPAVPVLPQVPAGHHPVSRAVPFAVPGHHQFAG